MSTNRSTNVKESKEKRNREKLLAGPGSEFSLANQEDLELDYYDYNVTNAGAAPGSYLGMDPAYLVWIPPMEVGTKYDGSDSDECSNTDENTEPYYEESSTDFRSPLSKIIIRTPQPEAPTLPPFNKSLYKPNESIENSYTDVLPEVVAANLFIENTSSSMRSRQNAISTSILSHNYSSSGQKTPIDSIQMNVLQSKVSTNKVYQLPNKHGQREDEKDCDTEKETVVVKSSSYNNINKYYELDDIQFVDEEDDCDDAGMHTKTSRFDHCDNKDTLVAQ